NSPAIFQSFINEILKDFLNKSVIAYIDDILIYSKSEVENINHVIILENQLYVKAEKCEFHVSQTSFLGYYISHQGIKMDTAKVQAVTEWPQPTTIKELQRFLGFANFYRRFIRNYSTVASPLTSLLKGKLNKLKWTEEANRAFISLKEIFTSAPILKYPDLNLPFIVESFHNGTVNQASYIHLTCAERNYDIGNKELLSMEGATHPFQVITDHKNLEYIRGAKCLNSRQARWTLFFTRFQFTVTYRPGSINKDTIAPSNLSNPNLYSLQQSFWHLFPGISWMKFTTNKNRTSHHPNALLINSMCPRGYVHECYSG
ncbi:hypothetical protein M9458_013622, partial [Cirrhinus mrigala]